MTTTQGGLLDALRQATLGEYDILGELGRGGMATVFVAHDLALDRRVAIKVMAPHLLEGTDMVERFKREARTAAALSHPHIIPIHAVHESHALAFFVMKLVEGRTLDSIIRQLGPLPVPMARAILQQVGSALGYAHRRGVVHRDVKPANVMIDRDGWAVVTDFGIAKVAATPGLTATGATLGTPSYMSPEQCAGQGVTGASDQYSLGVVAYEMLTGTLPFTADSLVGLLYQHVSQPPPPVTAARPDCPLELAEAVRRMLEKEAGRRFPDLEAAATAIGGAPLARDDPARTRLVTLAASGPQADLLRTLRTPVSPAPARRTAATVTAAPAAPQRRFVGGLLGVAALAVLASLVWSSWRERADGSGAPRTGPTLAAADSARDTLRAAPPSPPDPAPVARAESAAPRERPREPPRDTLRATTPGGRVPSTTDPAPPPGGDRPARPSAGARRDRGGAAGDSALRALRQQALAARDRAVAAGATPAELAAGDAAGRRAEAAAAAGEWGLVLRHLGQARGAWAAAERQARARAVP